MLLPNALLALVLPVVAERTERRRLEALRPAERRALEELRRCGLALEWDVRTAVGALVKVTRRAPQECAAQVRLGLARGWAEGSLPSRPSLREILRASIL